jgi:hypothetical protein
MQYNDIRGKIRPGDLLAFSHEGWKSWSDVQSQIVRIATRSEYTHVGIAWPVAGRVMILEAVVPRIRIFPVSNLLPFYWLPLSSTWDEQVEEYALGRVGEEYSKWEAIKGYYGWTNDGNRKWQCAEYARVILSKAGIPLDCKDTPTALVKEVMELDNPQYLVTK